MKTGKTSLPNWYIHQFTSRLSASLPAGAVLWHGHEVIMLEIVHRDFDCSLEDLYTRVLTGQLEPC